MKVSELLRLACYHAEMDRLTYLDCIGHLTDAESLAERRNVEAFVKQLHSYRLRRWGKTVGDAIMEEELKPISLQAALKPKP